MSKDDAMKKVRTLHSLESGVRKLLAEWTKEEKWMSPICTPTRPHLVTRLDELREELKITKKRKKFPAVPTITHKIHTPPIKKRKTVPALPLVCTTTTPKADPKPIAT